MIRPLQPCYQSYITVTHLKRTLENTNTPYPEPELVQYWLSQIRGPGGDPLVYPNDQKLAEVAAAWGFYRATLTHQEAQNTTYKIVYGSEESDADKLCRETREKYGGLW